MLTVSLIQLPPRLFLISAKCVFLAQAQAFSWQEIMVTVMLFGLKISQPQVLFARNCRLVCKWFLA